MLSVDGQLRGTSFNDFVDQVVGDGEGGPNVTTGWKSFTRNVGLLPAGTHQIVIGGLNTQKTAANESTTILIDNALVEVRTDDCAPTFRCAPVLIGPACDICDQRDAAGKCVKECPKKVLRCGHPQRNITPTGGNDPNGNANCADDGLFPANELCQQIDICPDP